MIGMRLRCRGSEACKGVLVRQLPQVEYDQPLALLLKAGAAESDEAAC